jgi:hypothetical protein
MERGEAQAMSGPIVRKYGFPNFEKIFGERPLEHGVEETESASEVSKDAGTVKGVANESATEASKRGQRKS